MKKLLAIFGLAFLVSGCSLFPSKQPAALKVTTTPKTTVFVDGKHMGTTPFLNEDLEPGEITLKLVPESGAETLEPWEGLIELTPGVVTVVNHEFAADKTQSTGEILTLQPNNQSIASLAVLSEPDAAMVRLDGESKNFTPLVVDQLSAGDHQLVIASPGYKERTVSIKAQTGYRLTVKVQLAKETTSTTSGATEEDPAATASAQATGSAKITGTPTATSSAKTTPTPTTKASPTPKASPTKTATGSATTPQKPYVKINQTSTGWLRVRSEPSLNASEVAKVNPGQTFALKDTQSGWYQIEYEAGKLGWIAGQYAEKYE